MSRKKAGAYYTPAYLADFVLDYVAPHFSNKKSISFLEPSVGDGVFLRAFAKTTFPANTEKFFIQAVEKNKIELQKAMNVSEKIIGKKCRFSFVWNDFLN